MSERKISLIPYDPEAHFVPAHPSRTVVCQLRMDVGKASEKISNFRAISPQDKIAYLPTGDLWSARSVDGVLEPVPLNDEHGEPLLDDRGNRRTMQASKWLALYRRCEQMSWVPGRPMLIPDQLLLDGGMIDRPGVKIFNLYRPPALKRGSTKLAGPWLDHIQKIYPDEAEHLLNWFAHRVQRPSEKINHAVVLGGAQGIGKDTLLEPVKRAVGAWNFAEVGPQQILGRFNGFLKSVILRVSEARDLGEIDRFTFYDRTKTLMAAPPDVLRVDEKFLREYAIPNCVGVVITTNHRTDGLYLPPEDRRHFVAWSDARREDFPAEYWRELYAWLDSGGDGHVAAWLAERDLSGFDPKAPPQKTPAFWAIADAGRAPEDAELADVIDAIGRPPAIAMSRLQSAASGDFADWLQDRKNRRVIPHRLEVAGYQPIRNPTAESGLWVAHGKRQVIYARTNLSAAERLVAAREITRA
ncbi:primase-helicase family protein [Bradyrhizobium sp. Leo170]|uniref:primase-helicase family protein n=1 Tax=Bradyrhizobium sp. Leo170 TaxID=1571199 RepID=UPI00102E2B2C|nr:primase-helicase family protein [Bradyrhizobium sp. Leo170]TAI67658.1 hypothetical protein CWO89_01265 [Bradyrhizobium sp. Leo170]